VTSERFDQAITSSIRDSSGCSAGATAAHQQFRGGAGDSDRSRAPVHVPDWRSRPRIVVSFGMTLDGRGAAVRISAGQLHGGEPQPFSSARTTRAPSTSACNLRCVTQRGVSQKPQSGFSQSLSGATWRRRRRMRSATSVADSAQNALTSMTPAPEGGRHKGRSRSCPQGWSTPHSRGPSEG